MSSQGGTLTFLYIRRLGLFLGFKILNFNIFEVFQKVNIFGSMKILWIFWGVSPQNWPIFRGHFYAF